MDNIPNKCPSCKRRVLRHSRVLQCCICSEKVHRECIPLTLDEFNLLNTTASQEWMCEFCSKNVFPFHDYSDEDEFLSELYIFFKSMPYVIHKINLETVFNPLDCDDNNMPLSDCDPDLNYYSDFAQNIFQDCLYYGTDEFNEMYDSFFTPSASIFAVGHINLRSIPAHLAELDCFLNCLTSKFSIIGVTENWLNHSNCQLYSLPNFQHEYKYRDNTGGGGVSLLIANHLNYAVRDDLSMFNDHIESLFIETDKSVLGTGKNVIVGVIYRTHTDPKIFNEHFETILHKIKVEDKICYNLGDYNFDILKHQSHKPTSDFLDILYSDSFIPLINRPTRVTESSATIIDNIFTNNLKTTNKTKSGIFPIDISDHFFIWHIHQLDISVTKPTHMFRRNLNDRNKQNFIYTLQQIDWNNILSSNDTQFAFSEFHQIYKDIYERSFPVIKVKFQYNNRKPWLSDSLRQSIKKKNKLYRKQVVTPTLTNELNYKIYKRNLTKLLNTAEKLHIQNLLEKNKSNLGKTWKIIKGIVNKGQTKHAQQSFLHNGEVITDKKLIAENFNNFFINIGPTLSKNIPFTEGNVTDYLTRVENSIFLKKC